MGSKRSLNLRQDNHFQKFGVFKNYLSVQQPINSRRFIQALNQLAFNFIWAYKPDKVKRNVIADYENGGVKILDVESFIEAQKVMWVKRLLNGAEGSWTVYPNYMLSKVLGKQSFQCTTNIKNLGKWMPKFYHQLFVTWNKTERAPYNDPFLLRREI